ncbi:class I SAM-dependent methyltransferase [Rhizobium sp. BK377]|uniref:class I SAM-dependent methyltransferase n=1 Tax=Rhizobium sp. BK377 TaxID=2587058 RepID=UPI0016230B6D|nr:class I SAM-dependent methyltransferase [Rhizobium sp. BK377]MBB3460098.1 tRNA (cmo5U34)-methyltransferase [Rhizobium sp. BK377]
MQIDDHPSPPASRRTASAFTGDAVKSYLKGPPRQVPGFSSLHRMAAMLMAERMPDNGRVLVLGAGGGLELKAFAEARAGWTFDGVDPSADMLQLAREVAGEHSSRIGFHQGGIDAAPEGPFDAAVCLLTFHHVPVEQRLEILLQIRRRLRAGAPFVVAHMSFPQTEPERSLWIDRHIAYGAPDGTDPFRQENARKAVRERLHILAPDEEEAMLRTAGFSDVSLFYAAFSFRGWVTYA